MVLDFSVRPPCSLWLSGEGFAPTKKTLSAQRLHRDLSLFRQTPKRATEFRDLRSSE